VTAIFAVGRADFRERSRTFGMVVIVAAALQLGYLFVPDASAAYSTVDLGGWRGVYDSAWMGACTAWLSAMLFPLAGFFLVRPASSRDARLGTYPLLASAPLSRASVVLAKWTSNVALLAALGAVLVIAAIAMQLLRGEDRAIDLAAYVVPYLALTIPVCTVTAALAIAIDAVPPLRGILGGVAWLFVATALIAVPLTMSGGGMHVAPVDPLGVTTLASSMFDSLHASHPAANAQHDIAIGGGPAAKHIFRFGGIRWSVLMLAQRAAWLPIAVVVVLLVSPFALTAPRSAVKRSRLVRLPQRLIRRLPLGRLLRAELASAFGTAGPWILAGSAVLAVLTLLLPAAAIARAIAPLVWIWPLGAIAACSVADARGNLDPMLLATSTPAWRRVAARWGACFALAIVPVAALALRHGGAGIALVAIAAALCALALALGVFTRSPVGFSSLMLIAWYLGPVNGLPALDPAGAADAPASVTAVALVATVLVLAATATRLNRRT
jgi:hypothetical protein